VGPILHSLLLCPAKMEIRFDTFLDQLGAVVDDIFRGTPNALMIVAGDFNARSPAWGDTRRNPRGHPLEN